MSSRDKKLLELETLLERPRNKRKIVFGKHKAKIQFERKGSDYLTISGSAAGIVLSGSNIVFDGRQILLEGRLLAGGATFSNNIQVEDDRKIYFGTDSDSVIGFNEQGDDYMVISGSSKGIVLSGSNIAFSGTMQLHDDNKLYFGSDYDAYITYSETESNKLIIYNSIGGAYFSGSSIHVGSLGAAATTYEPTVTTPVTALDVITDLTVVGTSLGNPIAQIVDGQGGGEMIKMSTFHSSVNTKGQVIYYYGGGGVWMAADRSNAADSISLLAVALDVDGGDYEGLVLLRGICRIPSTLMDGTPAAGQSGSPIYLSTTAGNYTVSVSTTNNDYVRIVGYILDSDGTDFLIYFNPSNDWVKVSA